MSHSDRILYALLAALAAQEAAIDDLTRQLREARADARTDRLTGLATLRALREFVTPHEDDLTTGIGWVLFVDGDDVKAVNDRYGHSAGDAVIIRIAEALRGAVDPGGLVARYGGDEFLALLPPGQDVKDAVARIVAALNDPLPIGGPVEGVSLDRLDTVSVRVSIGARRAESGVSFPVVRQDADAAMYWAKAEGRRRGESCCHYWSMSD